MFKFRYWILGVLLTPFCFLLVQADDFPQIIGEPLDHIQEFSGSGTLDPPSEIREIEVSATLPDYPWKRVADYRGYETEKCITCHEGIEEVGPSHPISFGCTVCHGGVGDSAVKDEAHSTLIYEPGAGTGRGNPSHLKVANKSCGQSLCHSGHEQQDRNHIERVKKSLMATLAGVISGLRFQWAGQAQKSAKYGVYPIIDQDESIPRHQGALRQLKALPYFTRQELIEDRRLLGDTDTNQVSHHIGDNLLRQSCFQCHLDSPGGKALGYRSQGCAACHVTYAEDGLYQGNDTTIDPMRPGHPRVHKITALPPNSTCTKCHKAFYENPANETADPETNPNDKNLFPGAGETIRDVHFSMGFDCIDCHTQDDIMGDGNLYSKQNQAVEIRCATCHGTGETYPRVQQITDPKDRVIRLSRHYKDSSSANAMGDWMVVSSRDNKLTNVKALNGKIVTIGKRSGRRYTTPLIRDSDAHGIPGHQEKLTCTACHSLWVPRCIGCHTTYDPSREIAADGKSTDTSNPWNPFEFLLDVDEPVLMMGPRGKVAPMLAQTPRYLSILDEQGKPVPVIGKTGDSSSIYRDWQFVNPHGLSGSNLVYAINPHSVSKNVRSCAGCHLEPRALGLAGDALKIGPDITGKRDRLEPLDQSNILFKIEKFAPGAKATVHGQPLAGSSQTNARPLNQEELTRILRVGNCIPCHDTYGDPIYQDMQESFAFEKTQAHRELRNQILNQQ